MCAERAISLEKILLSGLPNSPDTPRGEVPDQRGYRGGPEGKALRVTEGRCARACVLTGVYSRLSHPMKVKLLRAVIVASVACSLPAAASAGDLRMSMQN